MAADKLVAALKAVDWNDHVKQFCSQPAATAAMAANNLRLAVWATQFEAIDSPNPALCFVREMQMAGHLVAVNTALACYKAAAGSLRTIVETALYYTYFRNHEKELATLVRSDRWYISKDEILDYHKLHTPDFQDSQQKLGVVAKLNPWYSKISSIIHGEMPGVWITHKAVAEMKPHAATQAEVLAEFDNCVQIVDGLFFASAGKEMWDYFQTPAKQSLLKGMPGDVKKALKLDGF